MENESDFPGLVANAQALEQSKIAHPQTVLATVAGLTVLPAISAFSAAFTRVGRVVQRAPTSEAATGTPSVRGEAINRPSRRQPRQGP